MNSVTNTTQSLTPQVWLRQPKGRLCLAASRRSSNRTAHLQPPLSNPSKLLPAPAADRSTALSLAVDPLPPDPCQPFNAPRPGCPLAV